METHPYLVFEVDETTSDGGRHFRGGEFEARMAPLATKNSLALLAILPHGKFQAASRPISFWISLRDGGRISRETGEAHTGVSMLDSRGSKKNFIVGMPIARKEG